MRRTTPHFRHAGLTLLEATISMAILSLFLTVGYGTLLFSNKQATISRLYTLAEETARDQIDRIQTVSPFNPQFTPPLGPQVPTELTLDSARGGALVQTIPLYADPNSGNTVVQATLTTSVTDTGTLNTRAAKVTVAYTFGKRAYQVVMNTLRTSDS